MPKILQEPTTRRTPRMGALHAADPRAVPQSARDSAQSPRDSRGLVTDGSSAGPKTPAALWSHARNSGEERWSPISRERLSVTLLAMPDDLPALRDLALLMLGYAGVFRRCMPAECDVEYCSFGIAACTLPAFPQRYGGSGVDECDG